MDKIFAFFGSLEGELFYNSHYLVAVVIVLFMLVYEWNRAKERETLYLIIAFCLMLVRLSFIHLMLVRNHFFSIPQTKPFYPIIDSWFNTLSLIFLAWAFLYPQAKGKSWFKRYFSLNIAVLFLYPLIHISLIRISRDFFSGAGLNPVTPGSQLLFIHDLFYSVWQFGIIAFTILYLRPRESPGIFIKIFLGVTLAIQLAHLFNLFLGEGQIKVLINLERVLPIVASFMLVLAIYHNILLKLKQTQAEIKDWNHKLEEMVHERTRELETRNKDLARAEHLARLGNLAAGLAHEIKNPLNSIGLNLELLKRYLVKSELKEKDEMQDIISLVNGEVLRLDSLIQEFLMFARPQKIKAKELDIKEFIQQVLTLIRAEADKKNIHIVSRFPQEKVSAFYDESLMKQVFLNIIINAFQSMENGGELKIILDNSGIDNFLTIQVSDTGKGIKNEIITQIFEPFFSTKENGSGLGLSIAQRIIEEHGGSITVKSIWEKGTNFFIKIPLVRNMRPR
ncbi:MAG: ATP-binding protein [bacterium]|nr:ATP-binding protein [bacterium]